MDDSAAYGDYYQWGRAKDGHQSSTSSGTQTPSSGIVSGNSEFIYGRGDWTTADSSGALRIAAWADGGKNDICPAGFSVPTKVDLDAETSNITDLSSAASSFLRIPASGFRDNSRNPSRLLNQGDAALLWARNIVLGRSDYSHVLSIKPPRGFSGGAVIGEYQRTSGLNVRCIRDKI